MATLEQLLYELALRALDQQERQVAELRARTGTLLAAAALSATFLGGTAVDRAGISALSVPAIAALGTTVLLCLRVLAPHRMGFALKVRDLYEVLIADADDQRLVHLRLARRLDRLTAANQEWYGGHRRRLRSQRSSRRASGTVTQR
jgi:hypothetical protein